MDWEPRRTVDDYNKAKLRLAVSPVCLPNKKEPSGEKADQWKPD